LTDKIKRRGPTLLWAVAGYGWRPWCSLRGSGSFFCLAMTGARHREHGHPQHRRAELERESASGAG